MNKIRIITLFVFLGIFTGIFQLGSMSTVSEEEAALFMEEFEKLVLDIDAFGIFVHNTTIALPMFIPGFGIFWGLFSSWSTGYAFAAIATSIPEIANISPLSILFLSPFALIKIKLLEIANEYEEISIKPNGDKNKIGIVILLLLAGGYVEFYMIELVQNETIEMPGF